MSADTRSRGQYISPDTRSTVLVAPDSIMIKDHQCVLLNSTNVLPHTQGQSLPTPAEDIPSKRRPPTPDKIPPKRLRLEADDGSTKGVGFVKKHAHRYAACSLLQTSSLRPPSSSPRIISMASLSLASVYNAHCP